MCFAVPGQGTRLVRSHAPDQSHKHTHKHTHYKTLTHTHTLPNSKRKSFDAEGRVLLTDHGAFCLANVYGPALTNEETYGERLAFKLLFYEVGSRG